MKRSENQYYKLIFDGNLFDDNPLVISYESRDDQGFNDRLMNKGNKVKELWPVGFTYFLQGHQPVDYFLGGSRYSVVSKVTAEIICSAANDNIELLPVNIVLNGSPGEKGSFYVLNVLQYFEALNWESTVWSSLEIPYNDQFAHSKIIKPAFNPQLLKEASIFMLSVNKRIKSGIYISKKLKETLEERNHTIGMEFMPIKTIIPT